jgi:hypothetical protein
MAIEVKSLHVGQLGTGTAGNLYTVPSDKSAIIKCIRLVNTDTQSRTVNLYVKVGSTTQRIVPVDMSLAAGALAVDNGEITLAEGNEVQGDASTASKIDCVISGIERDA